MGRMPGKVVASKERDRCSGECHNARTGCRSPIAKLQRRVVVFAHAIKFCYGYRPIFLLILSSFSWPGRKVKTQRPQPYPNPVKLASVWSPEMLTQVGRVPTRGFGARLFFDQLYKPERNT